MKNITHCADKVKTNPTRKKPEAIPAAPKPTAKKATSKKAASMETDKRPLIRIDGGKLPEMVNAAEAALLSNNSGIYQRSGMLVRIINNHKITHKGVDRNSQFTAIIPVDVTWLCEQLTAKCQWQRPDKRFATGWKLTDCPPKVAETLLARGEWKFPELAGVINCPTLRWDGSILETPGYDPQSCLLYRPDREYPKVPDHPNWDAANMALSQLKELINEFPFDSPASTSVAISAILTAVIRRSLRVAPAHAFSAPKMGSGKTLQADIASLIATGRTATKITKASSSEEEKKLFMSLLLEGEQVICIDNIEESWGSDALCTILTETEWGNRLLGLNKTPKLPTSATWVFTGNNLRLSGDLADRTLLATIDAGIERPDERTFKIKDIREYVLTHRAELVIAALTILRAYHVAERPPQPVKPFNRFTEWSVWVRAAIIWAEDSHYEITKDGHPADPCLTREKVKENDPVRQGIGGLLTQWYRCFGENPTRIKDVILRSNNDEGLESAMIEFASDKNGHINAKSIAWKLKKYQGRVENGLKIINSAIVFNTVLWKVVKI